uniref:Cytochrome P450 33D3 n=1 Tax=Ganoderma boninense TaxID=34458 RepID=A0A5K1K2X7_9APHY|nr:Cytochrome P450 33D3 [Ganoderma boninense]
MPPVVGRRLSALRTSWHEHGHNHDHAYDFAAANRAHCEEYAHDGEEAYAGWRGTAHKELDVMLARCMQLEKRTVVLDFPCGVAVDISSSQVSVDRCNVLRVAAKKIDGWHQATMKAISVELRGGSLRGKLEGTKFDLITALAASSSRPVVLSVPSPCSLPGARAHLAVRPS